LKFQLLKQAEKEHKKMKITREMFLLNERFSPLFPDLIKYDKRLLLIFSKVKMFY